MLSRIIAKNIGDIFWDTMYIYRNSKRIEDTDDGRVEGADDSDGKHGYPLVETSH